MSISTPDPAHEVYVNPATERMQLLVRVGPVLLVVLALVFGYLYISTRAPEDTTPAVQYWYSSAPIKGMTFNDLLFAEPDIQQSVAGHYLAQTTWKQYLALYTSHEAVKPAANELVKQTVLLVASDTPLEADIKTVFDGIIADPVKNSMLAPPRE